MSIIEQFDFRYRPNKIVCTAEEHIHGVYEIGGFVFLAITPALYDDFKKQLESEEVWSVPYRVQEALFNVVIYQLNEYRICHYMRMHYIPFICCREIDSKTTEIEMISYAPFTNSDLSLIRKVLKSEFGKYRLSISAEKYNLDKFLLLRSECKVNVDWLTLTTLSVKVPSETIAYHTLIEKFRFA